MELCIPMVAPATILDLVNHLRRMRHLENIVMKMLQQLTNWLNAISIQCLLKVDEWKMKSEAYRTLKFTASVLLKRQKAVSMR